MKINKKYGIFRDIIVKVERKQKVVE